MTKKIFLGPYEDLVAELAPNNVWMSNDDWFTEYLNLISPLIAREMTSSDGFPRGFIFDEIVKIVKPKRVIDDDESGEPDPEGITY